MEIDTLIYKNSRSNNASDRNLGSSLVLQGLLQSDNSKVKLVVGSKEYFDFGHDKYAIYKNNLTDDFFLKNAPDGYYKDKRRSFLMTMYLKASLFPLIGLIIFLYQKYYSPKL